MAICLNWHSPGSRVYSPVLYFLSAISKASSLLVASIKKSFAQVSSIVTIYFMIGSYDLFYEMSRFFLWFLFL